MKYKLYINNIEIIDDVYLADTFFKRLRGYMFYEEPFKKAIVITPCNSIHSFFMKFPIDVLFLDSDMIVIKKEINFRRNKIINIVQNSKYVVETKAFGFNEVSVGDVVNIS